MKRIVISLSFSLFALFFFVSPTFAASGTWSCDSTSFISTTSSGGDNGWPDGTPIYRFTCTGIKVNDAYITSSQLAHISAQGSTQWEYGIWNDITFDQGEYPDLTADTEVWNGSGADSTMVVEWGPSDLTSDFDWTQFNCSDFASGCPWSNVKGKPWGTFTVWIGSYNDYMQIVIPNPSQ